MGTHPIFESDFDCLTDSCEMSEETSESQEVAWWLRWLTRGVGFLGGVSSGVGAILTFVLHIATPTCLAAAVIMLFLSFLLFVLEATIICGRWSAAQPIVARIDSVKFWMKATTYCALSILCFGLCHSSPVTMVGTLILPFATGVLYGLMSLGKKADRGAMSEVAAGNNYKQFENEP